MAQGHACEDDNTKRPRPDADDSDKSSSKGKKRLRVSRACLECRRRKDRCDGHQPCCSSCARMKRVCNYNPSKKRGLRSGYVRSLEMLLGVVFQAIEGSETWMLGLVEDGQPQTPTVIDECRKTDVLGTEAPVSFLDTWRNSKVAKEMERLLRPGETAEDEDAQTETLQKKLFLRMEQARAVQKGTVSMLWPAVPQMGRPSTAMPPPPLNDSSEMETILEIPMAANAILDMDVPSMDLLPLISPPESNRGIAALPADWSSLLDLYFAHTHCWFPISQKHDLLRTAHMLGTSDSDVQPGDNAFLWSVMALSSHQAHPAAAETREMYKKAQDMTERVCKDIGHARALLVLVLLHWDQGLWDTAWVTLGKAIYLITSLFPVNLSQTKPNTTRVPDGVTDDVRRVTLGCFVLETMVAAALGKRPYFRSEDIHHIGLVAEDGIEEWEPWRPWPGHNCHNEQQPKTHHRPADQTPGFALSTFNQFVHVSGILNSFLFESSVSGHSHMNSRGVSLPCLPRPCDVNASPQQLNLRTVSLCLSVLAETSTGNSPMSQSGDPQNKLQDTCASLCQRVSTFSRCSIAPTTHGYLKLLAQNLDHHVGSGRISPSKEREWRAAQESLSCMLSLCCKTPRDQASYMVSNIPQSKTPRTSSFLDSIQDASCATTISGHTSGHLFDIQADPCRPYPEPPFTPSTHQETDTSDIAFDDATQTPKSHLPNQQALPGTATAGIPEQELTTMMSDLLTSEADDDTLFDSLASLDSAEWLANSPLFMEHLGVLRAPVTADLSTLFDNL